jgi:hypothetical protein
MFAVRDELFDFAADGNVAFDHPAYTLLRRQMNGFIRYGHQLTVFRGLMTAVIHKIYGRRMESTWWDEWQQALESLNNPATREALEGFHRRAMMLAMKRLLYGSPLLWTMTLIFLVQSIYQGVTSGLMQALKAASRKVFTGPINDRLIEEAAQGEFA